MKPHSIIHIYFIIYKYYPITEYFRLRMSVLQIIPQNAKTSFFLHETVGPEASTVVPSSKLDI